MNPKEIVKQGYDKISYNYRSDDGRFMPSDYGGWLAELTPHVSQGAPLLELGCGCGVPVAQILAGCRKSLGFVVSRYRLLVWLRLSYRRKPRLFALLRQTPRITFCLSILKSAKFNHTADAALSQL